MELWLSFILLGLSFLGSISAYVPCMLISLFFGRAKNHNNPQTHGQTVSVIIPAFNEAKIICKKIQNTLAVDFPRDKTEIIVVDDGSTDGTTAALESYAQSERIKVLRIGENKGKANAISEGIAHSKGEILVISDADTILPKDALEELLSDFRDETVGVVFGKECMLSEENVKKENVASTEASFQSVFDVFERAESKFDSCVIVNGAFCALRRKAYEPLKSHALAEDTYLAILARKKGFKVIFEENALYYHIPARLRNSEHTRRGSILAAYDEKKRRSYGVIQAIMNNKDMIFNREYGRYGLFLLPTKLYTLTVYPFILLLSISAMLAVIADFLILLMNSVQVLFIIITLCSIVTAFLFVVLFRPARRAVLSLLYFVLVSLAMIHAVFAYVSGKKMRWSTQLATTRGNLGRALEKSSSV